MKTVVGLYSSVAEANKVKAALETEGYATGHITVIDQTAEGSTGSTATGSGETFTEKVKDFFGGFSEHKDEHAAYSKNIGDGGALLAVTVPDEQAEETADALYEHGATGIEGDYASSSTTGRSTTGGAEDVAVLEGNNGTTGYASTTTGTVAGEQVIPVVAEDLVVGKRQVQRGGVRVYSHVVSEPVSESISLHDERVLVDRRVVDRAATEADFVDAGPIEVRATGEEAVVGKSSRVIEEVVVGKTATDHTETVSDTVRHTEVDVEPVTAGSTTTTTKTNDRY